MRATRLRIVVHTPEDAGACRLRKELASSVSTSSPHLVDEVLSGELSEVLSLEIFRIYKRARPFSSTACVIIGTKGVDEVMIRLLCDAAQVGVFEGDGNEKAFSAQLLSQPTSGEDASIGFGVLRRGQIMEGLVDFSHISNITSLSIRSCGRTLHVVVGAHMTPTSLALIRSSVHGLVIIQAGGSDERKGDVLTTASDLRSLCFDCEDADYELETLEALTAISDPVSALELYCRGKASSQALSDELSRIISLLKSTDVRGSHQRAKDVDGERGNSLDVGKECAVAASSSAQGRADLLPNDEVSHPPPDLMNETVSAVANKTASYAQNQVSGTESPVHTENGQPTIARVSTTTSLNSVGIPRLTSYIPPAPFRTEVVLASTGW